LQEAGEGTAGDEQRDHLHLPAADPVAGFRREVARGVVRADRAKAWSDLMVGGMPIAARHLRGADRQGDGLAQKYNIRGTPTIFLSNGERIPGAVPVTQLEQKLAQIK
jgi:hypothetical protein